jgi:hypothetical protein
MARSEHGGDKSEEREGSEASETPIYYRVRRGRGGDELVTHEMGFLTFTCRRRDLEEALAESGEETLSPEDSSTDVRGNYVEIDDAYFDEVRRAVGGGAPTVLLGTSTKSLERNLEKLKELQRHEGPLPASQHTASPESKMSTPSSVSDHSPSPVPDNPSSLLETVSYRPRFWHVATMIYVPMGLVFLGWILTVIGVLPRSWQTWFLALVIATSILATVISLWLRRDINEILAKHSTPPSQPLKRPEEAGTKER